MASNNLSPGLTRSEREDYVLWLLTELKHLLLREDGPESRCHAKTKISTETDVAAGEISSVSSSPFANSSSTSPISGDMVAVDQRNIEPNQISDKLSQTQTSSITYNFCGNQKSSRKSFDGSPCQCGNFAGDEKNLVSFQQEYAVKCCKMTHSNNVKSINTPFIVQKRSNFISENQSRLASSAKKISEFRKKREKVFPKYVANEICWELLVELFYHSAHGIDSSTKSLCIGLGCSQTTALRMLERLERSELIERYTCARDRRVTIVKLTKKGTLEVGSVLLDLDI